MSAMRGLMLSVVMMSCCHASLITIGPNGINSLGLRDAQGNLLDGAGIAIGQVEPHRPGDADAGDTATFRNSTIDPVEVYVRDGAPIPNDPATVQDHGSWVAGVMISSDNVRRGVAPSAELYSSAIDPAPPFLDQQAAISAQHIALQNGEDVRVINMSFAFPVDSPTHILDGNQLLTQFVDWSASEHNVLYVVSGKNTTSPAGHSIPADNFNGITVAASSQVGGVYRRVATINDFSEPVVGARTMVSLLAPGDNVELAGLNDVTSIRDGRSFAAPHVTGTVALLQEFAESQIPGPNWDAEARRHEVMKAVLMNSADKLIDDGTIVPQGRLLGMERTVLKQDGTSTWLNSKAFVGDPNDPGLDPDTVPLDDQMGAGHLNAKRALQQFIPGKFDLTPAGGGDQEASIPPIGWDFGHTNGTFGLNRYIFNEELQFGEFISITLAWDRLVEFEGDGGTPDFFDPGDTFKNYTDPDADDVINDLDLFLVDTDIFAPVLSSIASVGTVEHIFAPVPYSGNFEIWVIQDDADVPGGQDYGLAWWYGLAPEIVVPIAGDFDGDNDVDGDDLVIWESAYAVNDSGDADGDGDSDGEDFLIWQRKFGTGVLSTTTTVPEPGAGMLAMRGLVLAGRRR